MANLTVTIRYRCKYERIIFAVFKVAVWLRLMNPDRAFELCKKAVYRFSYFRVGQGPWRRLFDATD